MPLRAIYRHAVAQGDGDGVANPTTDLRLPAVRVSGIGSRAPEEAAALIEALPVEDRALGRRRRMPPASRGPVALRWADVDLAARPASVTITLDRYGHLTPGNEGEAADLLDAYRA
jgi:hypothetical protein